MMIRLLNREILPFTGWTSAEAVQMQHFIDEIWLPVTKRMLAAIYDTETATKIICVIKTHMVVRHGTDRLLDIGSIKVPH